MCIPSSVMAFPMSTHTEDYDGRCSTPPHSLLDCFDPKDESWEGSNMALGLRHELCVCFCQRECSKMPEDSINMAESLQNVTCPRSLFHSLHGANNTYIIRKWLDECSYLDEH
mmetsp:Transcript_18805/g.32928  ORF Transcript_18805/g.32928 Transcript_18805/m.32928 type:complete len:113 (+) Transcript_18805:106-444(+)